MIRELLRFAEYVLKRAYGRRVVVIFAVETEKPARLRAYLHRNGYRFTESEYELPESEAVREVE